MKNYKRYIFILAVLMTNSSIQAQDDWIKLISPTDLNLWRVQCIDSLNCWAVGDSGMIIHTSNGGSNWQIQNSGIFNNIQDVHFINNKYGWVVGIKFDEPSGSFILKTTNGGLNWQNKFFDSLNIYLLSVFFVDSLTGFIGGAPSYTLYKTTDGGNSWNSVQFDNTPFAGLPIFDIKFYSKQYGFACGGQRDLIGVIWKTTDAGLSWSSLELGPEPLMELYIKDSLNVVGVGGDFEYGAGVARTTNGGISWMYTEPGIFGVTTGLSFRTKDEVWACLDGEGKFIVSSNSGLNWEIKTTPEQSGINDITFTDSLHGFAIGDGGVILKYKPQITSVIKDEINIPSANYLFQNYPNPFNPSTKISWKSLIGNWQTLKIYDVLGNEIVTLVDEYKPAGSYEVEFYASDKISGGIYFYQLKIGESLQAKKMILLR